MNYADEGFYKEEYLAGREAVITAAFPYYAREASQRIRQYAGQNIDEDNIPECVKMCCCELAEQVFTYTAALAESSGVSSESVQGWSVNYRTPEELKAQLDGSVRDCVYKWLSGTGLLFSGVM